jgi:hypothetical protein
MKKFIIAALAAIFCTAFATAQLVESRSGGAHIYKVKNPPPEMRYTLKLSGGIARILGSYQNSTGPAADLSFGVERHFNYKSKWYWGGKVGVGITLNTFKFDAYDNTYSEYTEPLTGNRNRQGYTYYGGAKSDDTEDNLNTVNFHIGPTIGFCKPISTNTKFNISFTPEFMYLVYNDEDIDQEYLKYDYTVYDDGTTSGDPDGNYRNHYYDSFNSCGVSGTLSVDFMINKFIVGVNGRYIYLTDSDSSSHFTIMASVGYAF